eukprot:GFUD01022364.1.p1 GENE.GFUD01022364.1~~GFUD01022364.1.p1  ORF type:complete len:281 (-),score=56.88 GFUD01022364.1:75-917(-)
MGDKPVVTAVFKDSGHPVQVKLIRETKQVEREPDVVCDFEEDDYWDKTVCPKCGKKYSTVTHMKVHYRTHTGEKPYICPYKECAKQFTVGYSLRTHIRVHNGDRPYQCSTKGCEKCFKTSSDLNKHTRTHTNVRPYICKICDKSFTTANIRKIHVRTHTGEKPFSCEYCGKSFPSKTNFQNHVRIHLGEKPFKCDVEHCDKAFTEHSSLSKHKKVHQARNEKLKLKHIQEAEITSCSRDDPGDILALPEHVFVVSNDLQEQLFIVDTSDGKGSVGILGTL